LGFFTLPEEIFGKYKELIKTTMYAKWKENIGEDPRVAYRRELI
jgi:hypothetical protein